MNRQIEWTFTSDAEKLLLPADSWCTPLQDLLLLLINAWLKTFGEERDTQNLYRIDVGSFSEAPKLVVVMLFRDGAARAKIFNIGALEGIGKNYDIEDIDSMITLVGYTQAVSALLEPVIGRGSFVADSDRFLVR